MDNNEAVVTKIIDHLNELDFEFSTPPLVIGGCAMEYYNLRKAGEDIDLVITDSDYQRLVSKYPQNSKDIYGDLGVILKPFEIWRSIVLADYDFYSIDSVDYEKIKIISPDKLLVTRVFAIGNNNDNQKYLDDLNLLRDRYYHARHTNHEFYLYFRDHQEYYNKKGGIIFGGQYE